MPQPLSRVSASSAIDVSALYIDSYPHFAAKVMRVISHWAHIEGNLATILSIMLKSDIATGAAMYTALSGGEAKKAALLAAARTALPPWQFMLLQGVFAATRHSRNERNDFAHHIWGVSDKLPDTLLLMHPNVILDANISHRQHTEKLPNGGGVIAPRRPDYSKIFVYRDDDFQQAVFRASAADQSYVLLYKVLKLDGDAQALEHLLNAPPIQQALQKLCRDSDLEVREKLLR